MPSTYVDYEVDIEDYHPSTRPVPSTRPGSSARLYNQTNSRRPASQAADTTASRIRRASANATRTTDDPQSAAVMMRRSLDETEPQARIKRQATRPHYPQTRQQQKKAKLHPLVWIGGGMCILLLCLIIIINVFAWWMNTVRDPAFYTQNAHRDIATVQISGRPEEQLHVFVDEQGHLTMLVVPVNDLSKSRIIAGPALTDFGSHPDQAMLTMSSKGDLVTVVAVGPYEVNGLGLDRPRTVWIFNLTSALKSGK